MTWYCVFGEKLLTRDFLFSLQDFVPGIVVLKLNSFLTGNKKCNKQLLKEKVIKSTKGANSPNIVHGNVHVSIMEIHRKSGKSEKFLNILNNYLLNNKKVRKQAQKSTLN